MKHTQFPDIYLGPAIYITVVTMGTLGGGGGGGGGQGREEDKFFPVLDIFCVFLQTQSLSTLLHSF